MVENEEKSNLRIELAYKDKSDKYLIDLSKFPSDIYWSQYFVVYQTRVKLLRDRLIKEAEKEFDGNIPFVELDELELCKSSFIYGVIVKRMKQRFSILTEFKTPNIRTEEDAKEEEMLKFSDATCSHEDYLEIETPDQIYTLKGQIDPNNFVTGFSVGLYGYRDLDEQFFVKKVILPELAPQLPCPVFAEDTYVMFLSGLGLDTDSDKNENTCLALSQLADWLYGCGGSDEEIDIARRVSRILFAGDCLNVTKYSLENLKLTKIGVKDEFDLNLMEQLDRVLEKFVHAVPIDIMPGSNDISSCMVPQQPILARAFDRCFHYGVKMFNVAPNPYNFELGGVNFLGTSGQNLSDSLKFMKGQSSMDSMRQFLEYSYLFPTCPDTIDGYPLPYEDPFIIDEMPHVLFAGNQDSHESKMCEFKNGARTLLMTIPKFCDTREAVILNLKTMETQVFRFDHIIEE